MKTYTLGIIGCGDFLRWQEDALRQSRHIRVKSLYDPNRERSAKYASRLQAGIADDADEILGDPEVDIVCLFVPPWLRRDLMIRAAGSGKHILATKPLASTVADAEDIVRAVGGRVRCGLLYGRTGNALIETAKNVFDGGEIGKMALYRQDWLHHYPAWNDWALDPDKNGGPFMDAMIHNLNAAQYLAGGPPTRATLFSDNLAHPALRCGDTECMKVDFAGHAAAYLFITWAADLAVHSTDGNDREHIDIFYMISSGGWRVTPGQRDGKGVLVASREGRERVYPIVWDQAPAYQRFVETLDANLPLPRDFVSLEGGALDVRLVRQPETIGK